MKFESITTPGVFHDEANMLTELMYLNTDLTLKEFPWKKRGWGRDVAVFKKLMRDFGISVDQLAFYLFKCKPQTINSKEFAKMAVVAKKLLRRFSLVELCEIYQKREKE